MGFLGWNLDRATRFEATIKQDKRDPSLPVLSLKGFDTFEFTVTKDQLAQIGEAIAKETGGNTPF